jgi:hypothetical protein
MLWLSRVIAQLRTTITGQAHFKTTALQTQTAGLAPQEPTVQHGNKRSAQDTHHHPQPVRQSRKQGSSLAQSITQVASQKAVQKPAQTTNGKRGRPTKTPV